MIETKTKSINGNDYSVVQLPARRALNLKMKLLKTFGAGIAALYNAYENDPNAADQVLPQAIMLLTANVDDKTFDQFVLDMLPGVRKNGMELTPSVIDAEFAGSLSELMEVLKFVLEANFGDFFREGGIINLLLANLRTNKTQTVPNQELKAL